ALQTLLQRQQRAFNDAAVGATIPVLFEKPGRHDGQFVGRSPYLQPVHADAAPEAVGKILPGRSEAVSSNSRAGTIVGNIAGAARGASRHPISALSSTTICWCRCSMASATCTSTISNASLASS